MPKNTPTSTATTTDIPPTPQPPTTPAATEGTTSGDTERGFPENTPLTQMTVEQREAYWRHYCRRNEDRVKAMADYEQLKAAKTAYDKLLDESRTEQEKAVAAAVAQGRAEATTELGGRMVEAYVRAAATGRLDEQGITTLLEGIDRSRFVDASGQVDAQRVYDWVNVLAPAPSPAAGAATAGATPTAAPSGAPAPAPTPASRQVPDYGQGTSSGPPARGLDTGREIAVARFGLKTSA